MNHITHAVRTVSVNELTLVTTPYRIFPMHGNNVTAFTLLCKDVHMQLQQAHYVAHIYLFRYLKISF